MQELWGEPESSILCLLLLFVYNAIDAVLAVVCVEYYIDPVYRYVDALHSRANT